MCLVCPEYYLCCKCHEEKHYSKPHRPYHPMQPVLSQQDFFKYVNSVVPPEDDIRLCCPYCGIWILTEAKLLQHCQIKHDGDDDRVRCPVCVTFCILEQSLTFAMFIDHLKKGHCERGRCKFNEYLSRNLSTNKRFLFQLCSATRVGKHLFWNHTIPA